MHWGCRDLRVKDLRRFESIGCSQTLGTRELQGSPSRGVSWPWCSVRVRDLALLEFEEYCFEGSFGLLQNFRRVTESSPWASSMFATWLQAYACFTVGLKVWHKMIPINIDSFNRYMHHNLLNLPPRSLYYQSLKSQSSRCLRPMSQTLQEEDIRKTRRPILTQLEETCLGLRV